MQSGNYKRKIEYMHICTYILKYIYVLKVTEPTGTGINDESINSTFLEAIVTVFRTLSPHLPAAFAAHLL